MSQSLETLKKNAREETRKHCEEAYGQILDKEVIDATVEYWSKRTDTLIEQVWNARTEEWHLGKKINVFDGTYIVVGLSQMIYDEDCEGEPEWKITKEVQEVAIAQEYDDISFQKPSWHRVTTLTTKISNN